LYGEPSLLNSYLSSGKLKVSGGGTIAVSGDASGTITVTAQTNTAATPALPTLNLPGSFAVLSSAGQLTMPSNVLGANSSDAREVVLTLSAGTLTATGLGGGVSAYGAAEAVATLTLRGSVQSLNTYLSTGGNLAFNGTANTFPTLTVSVRALDSTQAVTAQTQKLSTLKSLSTSSGLTTSSSLEPQAPGIGFVANSIPITEGAASTLVFDGFDLTEIDAGELLTATISLPPSSSLTLTDSEGLSAISAAGAWIATNQRTITLSSIDESTLEDILKATAGRLIYIGPAQVTGGAAVSATLSVTRASGATATVVIPVSRPAQVTGSPAVLALPASLATTPGALFNIPFTSSPLTGSGNALITFNTGSTGAKLEWAQSSTLKVSSASGAATLAASTAAASAVSLYGSIADLNAYLSAGNLKVRATGAGNISVTVVAGDYATSGNIPVSFQTNAAQSRTGPALVIPTRFNIPASTGLIGLAADGVLYNPSAGTGSSGDVLTLTLSIPNSVALSGGQGLSRVNAAGTTDVVAAARSVQLTGTAAQLNDMLRGINGADRVRYSGPVSAQVVFGITEVSSTDGAPISASATTLVNTVSTVVTADPTVFETTATLASLPTTLWATPGRDSDLRFTAASVSEALGAGGTELRLRFVPGAGSGTLTAATNVSGVTLHSTSPLEIRGTASALSEYLATNGALRYNGNSASYTLELRDGENELHAAATIQISAVTQSAVEPPVPFTGADHQVTGRAVFPVSLTVTPGALAPLQSGAVVSLTTPTPSSASALTIGSVHYMTVAVPSGGASGSVWGSDVYTADSSLARAAVFEGLAAPGQTRVIKVTVLPGLSGAGAYTGSTRNGIQTSSWGSYPKSFSIDPVDTGLEAALLASGSGPTGAVVNLTGLGTLDIDLEVPALSLTVTPGSTGISVSSLTSPTRTRLTGTAAQLTSLFATPGAVQFDAATGGSSIPFRIVQGGATGTISLTAKTATTTDQLTRSVPTLAVASLHRTSEATSTNAATQGKWIRVVLSSELPATDTAKVRISGLTSYAISRDNVTVDLTNSTSPVFSGTVSALNSYFANGHATYAIAAGTTAPLTVSLLDSSNQSVSVAASEITAYSLATSSVQQQPGLPASMSVINTGASASSVVLAGALVSGSSGSTNATVTILALDGGTLTAVSAQGAVATTVSASEVTLAGTVSQINTALSALGTVTYQRSSSTTDSERLRVTTQIGNSITQTITTLPEPSFAGAPTLTLPASVTLVPDANSPVYLGTDRLSYSGSDQLRLTVTAPSGTLSTGSQSNGVSIVSASAGQVVLQGLADNLDAWISAGKLRYNTLAAGHLQVTVESVASGAIKAYGRVDVALATLQQGGVSAAPTITLPDRLRLASAGNTDLVVSADPFDAADSRAISITLIVPAESGDLTLFNDDTLTGGAANADGVTVSTATISGKEVATLSGSAAALNTFFTTAGKITYNSIAGDLKVTVSAGSGNTLRSLDTVWRLESPVGVATPQIDTLPQKLMVTNGYDNRIAFSGLALTGSGTLALVLALPSTLNLGTSPGWSAPDTDGVDATVSADRRTLTLEGTATALQTYLQRSDRVSYNGPGQVSGVSIPVALELRKGTDEVNETLAKFAFGEPVQPTTTDQNIRLTLSAAQSVTGEPGMVSLVFPSTAPLINLSDVADGQVVFVDLEVPRSTLTITGLAANATGAIEGGAITVATGPTLGSGVNTFTATRFIGTAGDLNAFFGAPSGKVRYDASSGVASIAARIGSYSLAVAGAMPTLGTEFTVNGVASGAVTYRVVSDDLPAAGDGDVDARLNQARANIAANIAAAINSNANKLATITATASAVPAAGTILLAQTDGPITITTAVTGSEAQLAVLGTTQTRGQIPIVRPNGSGVQLQLAEQYVFSDTQLPFLTFPSNALTTTDASKAITVTLTVSVGALSWANKAGITLPAGTAINAANAVGTGATLTLTGTASQLNGWLSTAGNLLYSGTQPATLTFAFTAASSAGGPTVSSTIPSSLIIRPAAIPAVSLNAPATLTMAPNASGVSVVAFAHDVITASGGTGVLTATLVAPDTGTFPTLFNDDTLSGGAENADGVIVTPSVTVTLPSGATRNAVQLTGSTIDLNRYLRAVGNIGYAGPGNQTLELRVTNPGTVSGINTTSTARITLADPGARAVPRLALPDTITLVPGADSPLHLGAAEGSNWLIGVPANTVNGGATRVAATITTSGGVLTVPGGGLGDVTVSGLTATTVTLTGTVAELSTWLNAGNLKLRTTVPREVSVELRRAAAAGNTLSFADAQLVATGEFDVALHQPAGLESRITSPAASLPGRISVLADTDSALTFAGTAFGTGAASLRTVIATENGSINVTGINASDTGTLTVSVGGVNETVTVSAFTAASGGGSRSFTGSAAALSALFAEAGANARVFVNGSAQQSLRLTTELLNNTSTVVASTTATIALYGALPSTQNQSVPTLVRIPSKVWITPDTASTVRFDSAALSGAASDTLLELRLSLPDTDLALNSQPGLALEAPTVGSLAVTSVSATASTLVLRGTAAQLAALLRAESTAGRIVYTGPGRLNDNGALPLELRLITVPAGITTAALTPDQLLAAPQSHVSITLAESLQPTSSNAGAGKALDHTVEVTPGAWAPLVFASNAFAGTGNLSVTFALSHTSGDKLLGWDAVPAELASALTLATGASFTTAVTAAGTGTQLRLTGSVSAINSYLSGAARLKVRADADGASITVTTVAPGATSAAGDDITSIATIAIDHVPVPAATAGVLPALGLKLPAELTVAPVTATVTPLAIADAPLTGNTTDTLTLDLSVPSSTGTLTAQAANGITIVTGSGTALRVSGTLSSLNQWLTSGGARYAGPEATLSVTFSHTVGAASQSLLGTLVLKPAIAQAPTLALAQSYPVAASNTSSLMLGATPISGGAQQISAVFVVQQGSFAAPDAAGLASANRSNGDQTLTLVGSVSQINTWLAAGKLRYVADALTSGASVDLQVSVTNVDTLDTSGFARAAVARVALVAKAAEETAGPASLGLALPESLRALSANGTVTALPLPGTPLAGAIDNTATTTDDYTLTLTVSQGTLSVLSGTLADTDADANELVVSGGIESLNAFLSSGALGYTGAGGTLTTVLSRGSQSVRGSINLVGTAELLPPVSLLPGAIGVVPDAASPIVFAADALGSDASRLRVTLSVSGDGSFSAASIGTPGTDANAVVVSGSGTTSTSFAGSASALSAYFANASRIAYTGVATQTMTVLVERLSNDSPFATLASNRASVQLYGASRLGESAPVITGLPTTLWITANTSSNLRFTGAAIANTPASEVLTLTLSLPAGNDVLALGTQPGLAATAGGGVTVDAASTARALILRGTAANLQSFLGSDGAIRYTGPATAAASAPLMLGVRLDNAVAASTVQALLAAPTQPATANAGGAMRLPAGVVATPGALATPAFAANAVTGTGLLTMRFAASSAATLVWQSDTALRTAAGGALLAAGSGSALTLVGSAAELSAWLAAARLTLLATGTGSVSVALESTPAANSAPVISNGVITVDYSPAQSTVAGAAALQLRLPLAATVQADAVSTIAIAGSTAARVGPATDTALTLGLRVATGTLSATNFAGLASGALSGDSRSLLLSGTAAQINSWLAAGRLSYTGAGEALEVVLGETGASAAQSLNGAVQLIAASPVVPTLSVPQSVPVLVNTASNLVLVGSPVAGSGTLTLTASVATGTLAAASDGALTDIDAAANMVRVSGTAAQINAWLEAGKLRYSGAGEALQLSVTNESGAARSTTARVALNAVVPVETAGPAGLAMALPRTIPVTSGANVALLMPGTPLGGAAGTVYTLTLAATAGTLTASPSRTGDAAALAALADLDSAAGVVRLQGSVATLNAWLSSGRLIYNGPAAVLNATLSLGDQSVSSAIDLSAGAASSSPTLVAPGVLPVVPNVASPIAFAANALGATSALRSVTLKVADGGVFTAVSAADSGVTVSGSGSATITLTGTAAAISAYLAASPASISYTGIATRVDANGMRAQTLFMAVDGSGNRSEAEIALYGATDAFTTTPSITSLSSRLWVTPAVSSHLKFDAATLGGAGALTLTLSLPAQSQLALGAGEGLMASLAQGETGVSVSASSTARTLVVSGTAAQLSALLAGTTGQIRYTGPGATATGTPIALQLQLVDSIGHASSTAVSLEAPTVSTATLSGATLTLPVSRVATPGARVPLMLGSEAFRAAGAAPISVEIEAPQAAVTVIGAVAGVVTLASGTVTVSAGDTFTREVDGTPVSVASTRLTGSAAALNELFSRVDGVMVESAAGGSIAIRVVGDISSRGQVAVTASQAPDQVVAGPSLRVPAGYTLPSGGTILLPTQAVAGEGVLTLVVSTSAGALTWAASSALRPATTGEATLT
ncbi:MAG: hypothetical protein FJY25_15305, partial [Betaproteobacteria bacterium]|nr:hypothetical protein [Betaproteobacteria bacterium]